MKKRITKVEWQEQIRVARENAEKRGYEKGLLDGANFQIKQHDVDLSVSKGWRIKQVQQLINEIVKFI